MRKRHGNLIASAAAIVLCAAILTPALAEDGDYIVTYTLTNTAASVDGGHDKSFVRIQTAEDHDTATVSYSDEHFFGFIMATLEKWAKYTGSKPDGNEFELTLRVTGSFVFPPPTYSSARSAANEVKLLGNGAYGGVKVSGIGFADTGGSENDDDPLSKYIAADNLGLTYSAGPKHLDFTTDSVCNAAVTDIIPAGFEVVRDGIKVWKSAGLFDLETDITEEVSIAVTPETHDPEQPTTVKVTSLPDRGQSQYFTIVIPVLAPVTCESAEEHAVYMNTNTTATLSFTNWLLEYEGSGAWTDTDSKWNDLIGRYIAEFPVPAVHVPPPSPPTPYVPPYVPPTPTPTETPTPTPTEPEPPEEVTPSETPTPAEPPIVTPTPRAPETPPIVPGVTLVPEEDGSYLEFDEVGTPLGRWTQDPGTGEWIFEKFPPLGEAPETGDNGAALRMAIAVASLCGAVMIGTRKKKAG
ncbi:MAG: hypothetical protein LBT12_04100 [Oscillospiraceae bacterium]|jgi:hypothetical protein|nr:hypothetical protein [Oscillospiraceae bacterium]